MLKKISLLIVAAFVLSSCQGAAGKSTEQNQLTEQAPGGLDLPQLSPVQKGEEIAVMDTDYGKIEVRFFPQYAPKAVENFVTHAKQGYYDGVIFHRVIKDFMIQSGDPQGTGMGGESIYGEGFGLELSNSLRHIRGALSMANTGEENSNGSQFFIVQNRDVGESAEELTSLLTRQDEVVGKDAEDNEVMVKDVLPTPIIEKYLSEGGAIWLDGGYTVFGQVISGMDVVDKIAEVETGEADKPVKDIMIKTITIKTY